MAELTVDETRPKPYAKGDKAPGDFRKIKVFDSNTGSQLLAGLESSSRGVSIKRQWRLLSCEYFENRSRLCKTDL
jgi:hypothetical protein